MKILSTFVRSTKLIFWALRNWNEDPSLTKISAPLTNFWIKPKKDFLGTKRPKRVFRKMLTKKSRFFGARSLGMTAITLAKKTTLRMSILSRDRSSLILKHSTKKFCRWPFLVIRAKLLNKFSKFLTLHQTTLWILCLPFFRCIKTKTTGLLKSGWSPECSDCLLGFMEQ